MSISFTGVTDITIPQGSVTKITETSTGRVLWEKPSLYPPLIFICAELNNNVKFVTPCYAYNPSSDGYSTPSYSTNLSSNRTLAVNSAFNLSGQQIASNTVSAGNKFTACYVTNLTEASNVPTTAKKLTDALWTVSDFYLHAISNLGYQGYHASEGIKVNGSYRPITFSSMSGSLITVSSVRSDMSYYKTLYESYSANSKYRNKTTYPYLYGSFILSCTSTTYKNLIGENDNDYAPELTCFFTLKR